MLKDMETKAFEAWKNKDGKFFEGMMDDKFMMQGDHGARVDKSQTIKGITSNDCDVKSVSLSDEKMTLVGADAAVITTTINVDGTCGGEKIPSPGVSASVYVRSGDGWKGINHNEVTIVDPKASSTPEKKVEAKKEPEANTAANSNSNTSNTSAAAADPTTDALVAVEKRGWEAWRAKDAKALEEILAKDVTVVDLFGNITPGKADIIKMWTADNKCEVKSVTVTEGKSLMITKDAAILLFRGAGDGACEGMAVKPVWGTTVYVKEGESWRAAYIFEMPA
jgi:ketosteroid isomerase-like protein